MMIGGRQGHNHIPDRFVLLAAAHLKRAKANVQDLKRHGY
jgi:hypothetical protein